MNRRHAALAHRHAARVWLASTLVLLAALTPSFGMLLHAAAPNAIRIEICSDFGVAVTTPAGSAQTSLPAGSHRAGAHCPLCILPGTLAGLLPAFTGTAPIDAAPKVLAVPGQAVVLPAEPRQFALTRAPPLLA